MSTGHLKYEIKGEAELYGTLGQNDTPELYGCAYEVDHSRDVPYAGGNSLNGKIVYIDRILWDQLFAYIVQVRGMTARQVAKAICEHEHSEWAIEMGDNSVQIYPAAHEFATSKEHRYVRMLGIDPERYEECLKPALRDCAERFIKAASKANPPRDLWCGPVLDEPSAQDKQIIRVLRARGVEDAFKLAKSDARYGVGEQECKDCAMFGDRDLLPDLRKCDLVNGLVRRTYWCTHWLARNSKGNGHG
jgi:hypothetical protein